MFKRTSVPLLCGVLAMGMFSIFFSLLGLKEDLFKYLSILLGIVIFVACLHDMKTAEKKCHVEVKEEERPTFGTALKNSVLNSLVFSFTCFVGCFVITEEYKISLVLAGVVLALCLIVGLVVSLVMCQAQIRR